MSCCETDLFEGKQKQIGDIKNIQAGPVLVHEVQTSHSSLKDTTISRAQQASKVL